MAFSGAFIKPFRPAFDAGLAAAVPWYLAGGAPTPIAVYQPKGAASLAASYANLVTPGTYNAAPGVAPTLDASGWVFNGTSQYLTTGVVPASGFSLLVRFSNRTSGDYRPILGCGFGINGERFFVGFQNSVMGMSYGYGTEYSFRMPGITTGVIALANNQPYRNGAIDGSAISGSLSTTRQIWIARGNGADGYFPGKIQAAAIWDTSTSHATWMPAVMAAVALI